MPVNLLVWLKSHCSIRLYFMILLTQLIVSIDSNKISNVSSTRQMCTKLQSRLSLGKYHTYQISSNVTYVSRLYTQNFLSYSPSDNLLIFIEPKHQVYIYDARSVRLIRQVAIRNVLIGASAISLHSNDQHELYFIYESAVYTKSVALRLCQVRFNTFNFDFENNTCIQTFTITHNQGILHINGFAIKRNHAETKRSFLFISTDIGLVYMIFDTQTGSLIRSPVIMGDTSNEGSIVVSSLGTVFYANKQENTIYELIVTPDFRIKYGKMIKSTAIKQPYGLITDECNHLYIATRSMILVMYVPTYTTIRSVFSKASDLPITMERVNATTYAYATMKKTYGRNSSSWMFNFLSFSDPEKSPVSTNRTLVTKPRKQLSTTTTMIGSRFLNTNSRSITSSLHRLYNNTSTTTTTTVPSNDELWMDNPTDQGIIDHDMSVDLHPFMREDDQSDDENLSQIAMNMTSTTPVLELSSMPISNDSSHLNDEHSTSMTATMMTENFPQFLTTFDTSSSRTNQTIDLTQTMIRTTISKYTKNPSSVHTSERTVQETSSDVTNNRNPFISTDRLSQITSTVEATYTRQFTTIETTTENTASTTSPSHLSHINTISHTFTSSQSFESSSIHNNSLTTHSNTDHLYRTGYQYLSETLISATTLPTTSSSSIVTSFPSSEPVSSTQKPTTMIPTTSSTELPQMTTLITSTIVPTSTLVSTLLIETSSMRQTTTIAPEVTTLVTTTIPNIETTFGIETTPLETTTTKLNIETSSKLETTSPQTTTIKFNIETSSRSETTPLETTITTESLEKSTFVTDSTEVLTSNGDMTKVELDTKGQTVDRRTTEDEITTSLTSMLDESSPSSSSSSSSSFSSQATSSALPLLMTHEIKIATSTILSTSFTQSSPTPISTEQPNARWTSVSMTPVSMSRKMTGRTSHTTFSTKRMRSFRTRRRTLTSSRIQTSTKAATTIIVQVETSSTIPIRLRHPKSINQQATVVQPPLDQQSPFTLLSNEIFNDILTSNTSDLLNSSFDKSIYIDLMDQAAATWSLSLQTNRSIRVDIALPPIVEPQNINGTTNLTLSNIQANCFSTNVIGPAVNLQVDQIETKEFSLTVDLTKNQTNSQPSDVMIGYIKSDKFNLGITKSDAMNLQVQQVDSATAELFFDDQFCTNASDVAINLNLSKNGTIRFGNRPPISIGPVFTRVHMLKHSCEREQPFVLFFDLCERENPCFNGGTCQSLPPNYTDPVFAHEQPTEISYRCLCPDDAYGDQCQNLHYPFGYCVNGGTLVESMDSFNRPIKFCSCLLGYHGEHCEENIDDCIGVTCSQHGICQDDINNYTCSCFDGFYGTFCEHARIETVVVQVASKSFAAVAILLISGIAALVVASDIHTYLTNRKPRSTKSISNSHLQSSHQFEHSGLLSESDEIFIELDPYPIHQTRRKSKLTRNHRSSTYEQLWGSQLTKTSTEQYSSINQV